MSIQLTYRLAAPEDCRLYFDWANDADVRANSYSPGKIEWENHQRWFHKRIASPDSYMLVFYAGTEPVGQLRLDRISDTDLLLDLSVDKAWRSRKVGKQMMAAGRDILVKFFPWMRIKGEPHRDNIASIKMLEAAGFVKVEDVMVNGVPAFLYYLYGNDGTIPQ
ncbi:MAG: GNAT family N-acetyltransferase [Chitinophagaceae bacterium]